MDKSEIELTIRLMMYDIIHLLKYSGPSFLQQEPVADGTSVARLSQHQRERKEYIYTSSLLRGFLFILNVRKLWFRHSAVA